MANEGKHSWMRKERELPYEGVGVESKILGGSLGFGLWRF